MKVPHRSLNFVLISILQLSLINGSEKIGELNGITLKVALLNIPPFDVVTVYPDGNFTHTGSNKEFFAWLSRKLNFKIQYFVINETAIAEHGSAVDLVLSLIAKNEVDTSFTSFIVTPERKIKMDPSYFTWTEPHAMVVPRPIGEEPRLFAFIKPFRPDVWLLILVTIIAMVLIMSLFSKIFSANSTIFSAKEASKFRKNSTCYYISGYLVYIVNILTNQGRGGGDPTTASRLSFRVLVGTWLLVATVIVNSYASTVISYLSITKMKSPINSFQDLAEQHNIELTLWKDTVIANYILESQSGAMKILGDRVRQNPKLVPSSAERVKELLRTGRYAFPFLKTFCDTFVVNEFKKDGKCRFLTTDPVRLTRFWSMGFTKNSNLADRFNPALIEAWEIGLPFFLVKMNTPQAPQCFAKMQPHSNSARQVAIRMIDLIGVFLFLGIGLGTAMSVFLIELISSYCLNYQQSKRMSIYRG